MLADQFERFLVCIILNGLLQASKYSHLKSKDVFSIGQVFDGAFCVHFASFVLGFVEDALDFRVETGLARRSAGALSYQSGMEFVRILRGRLTLHFLLLHDSQAIDTRALEGAAGPAAAAELTVEGRIWREWLGSVIEMEICSLG
jgi:hypothetical protein